VAIDGIGGGDSDTNAIRRRALEEQKARELDRIEDRYKKQVKETQKNRQKALEQVYQATEGEVESKRDDAQFKVDRAKQAADERVRAFEQDALRMTEEAKRQFEHKAKALEKASLQMDNERRYLAKQHSDTMAHIQKEREERYNDLSSKHAREALRIENEYKRRNMTAEQRHASEIAQKEREIKDKKAAIQAEGNRTLDFLQRDKANQAASIENEVNHTRQQGRAQIEEQRINQATQKMLLDSDHAASIDEQNRRYNLEINRTSMRGKRMLDETREKQMVETFMAEKDGKEKVRNAQTQAAVKLATIENEGKLKEHLAKQAFSHQQQIVEQNNQQSLNDARVQSEFMRKQAAENLNLQSKQLKEKSEKTLGDQTNQYATDIMFNRKIGQKQLDATVLANAKKVASYSSRAADPFYRVHNLNVSVSDGDQFVTLKVPASPHDEGQVRVTHQPGRLTVSTTRRFEGNAESDDGRKVTTNSYQSYSESVPITGALNMKDLTKTFDGSNVIFKIPRV